MAQNPDKSVRPDRSQYEGVPSNSISRELAQMIREKFFPKKATTIKRTGRKGDLKEALRRAEEIRRMLADRQHTNSTGLIVEDRKR